MTRTPTRSTQFLTGLATVVLVAGIGYCVLLGAGAVAGFGPNGDDVAVHTQVDRERITGLPGDVVGPEKVAVTVRHRDASREQLVYAAGRDLAPTLLVVAAVWLLRGLLRTVRDGDPFIEANVKRLRALALVVLAGIPLATLVSSLFAGELAASAGLESSGTQLSIGPAFLGGLAMLVLAEVFAGGVRLRGDLEGTV